MPLEPSPHKGEAGIGGREGGGKWLPGPLPGELLPTHAGKRLVLCVAVLPCLEQVVPEVSNSQLQ